MKATKGKIDRTVECYNSPQDPRLCTQDGSFTYRKNVPMDAFPDRRSTPDGMNLLRFSSTYLRRCLLIIGRLDEASAGATCRG